MSKITALFPLCAFVACYRVKRYLVDSSWNVMAHGDALEGKWRGNWRVEWVASTLHTTSEHGVSSITTADPHTSAVSSWLNWRPRRFKWTRPFRHKTKSGFCACAVTFQLASTSIATTCSVKYLSTAGRQFVSPYWQIPPCFSPHPNRPWDNLIMRESHVTTKFVRWKVAFPSPLPIIWNRWNLLPHSSLLRDY